MNNREPFPIVTQPTVSLEIPPKPAAAQRPPADRTRVLIADDHEMFRAGIRAMLERMDNVEVIGDAVDGRGAISLSAQLGPDIVLMDVSIPVTNCFDATREMVAARPKLKVIVCSAGHDDHLVEQAFTAGACGYLLKNSPAIEVAFALRAVGGGEVYLSPKIAGILLKNYIRITAPSHQESRRLSKRERAVLQLVVDGNTNREISARLSISVKTVEGHRAQLMEKLRIHTVAELTKYAIREGLTSLDT